MNHVLSSTLWKNIFRHGLSNSDSQAGDREKVQSPTGELHLSSLEEKTFYVSQLNSALSLQVEKEDRLVDFLAAFAKWEPTPECPDARVELMRSLMLMCKKQAVRNEIAGSAKVDQAVNALWAAMVYHTPALHHSLRLYGRVTPTVSLTSNAKRGAVWLVVG